MSAAEIDAYLAGLDGVRLERMAAVVDAARAHGADEGMDWGMPVFRKGDRYFAAKSQKNYVSLYLGCLPDLCARVAASDPKLKHGKACVNVTDSRPLPLEALKAALADLLG